MKSNTDMSYRDFLNQNPEAANLFMKASSFKMKKIFKRVYLLSKDELELFIKQIESRLSGDTQVR